MSYLIGQIIICLLIAFLLGLLIGCLLRSISCKRKLRELEEKLNRETLKSDEHPKKTVVPAPILSKVSAPEVKKVKQTKVKKTASTVVIKAKPIKSNVVDDLKEIGGVGPFLEKVLNNNGVHNFRQIAELKTADIRELSTKIGSFKNRIIDDKWVSQAKQLYKKKYGEKV